MPRKTYRLTIWKESPDQIRQSITLISFKRGRLCRMAALLHWSKSPDLNKPDYKWWAQFGRSSPAMSYTNSLHTFEFRLEVCGADTTKCGENTTPRPIDTNPVSCDNATS